MGEGIDGSNVGRERERGCVSGAENGELGSLESKLIIRRGRRRLSAKRSFAISISAIMFVFTLGRSIGLFCSRSVRRQSFLVVTR